MKTMMFLLVSAVTLLVSPAPHKPDDNLVAMIDLIETYNTNNISHPQPVLVEDLKPLVEGGCKDKFFCKAHHILHKHENFRQDETEEGIVRNLKKFIGSLNTNCTEEVKGVKPTVIRPVPQLVEYLKTCIQRRKINMNITSNN